jgi:hypothetical protein
MALSAFQRCDAHHEMRDAEGDIRLADTAAVPHSLPLGGLSIAEAFATQLRVFSTLGGCVTHSYDGALKTYGRYAVKAQFNWRNAGRMNRNE